MARQGAPGQHFAGEWKVTVSSDPGWHDQDRWMIIRHLEGDRYALFSSVDGCEEGLQVMEYVAVSDCLVNLEGQRERCIAYWGRQQRDSMSPNSIFGKRVAKSGSDRRAQLAPWESDDQDGTWGAEDGFLRGGPTPESDP